ncbi:MAG: hypothetical protein GEU98_24915 [Pseudonocardiaceae bacterium]|nr:hypothetical protein [Pseudonocardiaceae bacterium]
MGITYCGVYADAINTDDHEGYAARILPDGTETGTWTYATREFIGYRAHCDCGWRGQHHYPATEQGEQLADDEWDHHHLRPLLETEARRHTVPATVLLAFSRELRESLTYTTDAQGDRVLTERTAGVLDAASRLDNLLDDLSREVTSKHQPPNRRRRAPGRSMPCEY